jgi:hypothetical protein
MSETADEDPPHPNPLPEGERAKRKPPRWVEPFLGALERTGVVRAAAENAGVDHTTAYVRRRTHADFADAWVAALERYRAAKKRADETPSTIASSGNGPPPPDKLGAEFEVSGGKVKRVSAERWGARKREAYLTELAITANHRRASKAAGISYEAVLQRRHNDPHLEAACKAAIEACRARAPEFLANAMAATFDPEAVLDSQASGLPKVSVAEAIKIAQMKGPAGAEAEYAPPDIEAVRERLEKTMRALNLIPDEEPERTCPHCGMTFKSGGEGGADT